MDYDTLCSFEKNVGSFAILKLANGKKAFAHISRIWIFKQPMFGGFRALSHPAYKDKININARSITPIKDVEYQVTYCHAGIYPRSGSGRNSKYIIPQPMQAWINKIVTLE